jgi:protein involved in polysaccharide export with SLBB domain
MPSDIRRRVADAGVRALLVRAALLSGLAASAWPATIAAQQAPNIPPPSDVKSGETSAERRVGGLRGGDLLRVVVFREKELSGDYLIDARGFVQIPGVGVLQVAGLEPQQAQERIVEALRARGFSSPEVSVQAQVRVSVLGEVRQPALYPTEPGTSLLQLLTIAGGPTERANLRATRVVRDGRVFVVDLESGLAGGAAGRVVLYSGDYVVVPRRTGLTRENVSFVLSLVGTAAAITAAAVTLGN